MLVGIYLFWQMLNLHHLKRSTNVLILSTLLELCTSEIQVSRVQHRNLLHKKTCQKQEYIGAEVELEFLILLMETKQLLNVNKGLRNNKIPKALSKTLREQCLLQPYLFSHSSLIHLINIYCEHLYAKHYQNCWRSILYKSQYLFIHRLLCQVESQE